MRKKIISFAILFLFSLLISSGLALAQSSITEPVNLNGGGKCLEIPLPYISKCPSTPADYLSGLYRLALAIGVITAVAMVIVAGIKYATSGDNASKQKDARDQIMDAVIGLVILFASVLILRTINPDLVNLGKVPKSEYNWDSLESYQQQLKMAEGMKDKWNKCLKICEKDAVGEGIDINVCKNSCNQMYYTNEVREVDRRNCELTCANKYKDQTQLKKCVEDICSYYKEDGSSNNGEDNKQKCYNVCEGLQKVDSSFDGEACKKDCDKNI